MNLGHVLAVRGIAMSGNYQRLNLDDEHDRAYVANELIAQNRASVGFRYREVVVPVIGNPTFRFSTLRPVNLAQLAQAFQWVRCYQPTGSSTVAQPRVDTPASIDATVCSPSKSRLASAAHASKPTSPVPSVARTRGLRTSIIRPPIGTLAGSLP